MTDISVFATYTLMIGGQKITMSKFDLQKLGDQINNILNQKVVDNETPQFTKPPFYQYPPGVRTPNYTLPNNYSVED